jgi:hypothetical protein
MTEIDAGETEQREKLFDALKSEIYKRELSNSDNWDKSVLAFATGALGFSLAFLKDFVPITKATAPWMLFWSWILLCLAIVATMVSFQVSQLGLRKQLARGERYYLQRDETAKSEINRQEKWTVWLNYGSGVCFLVGLAFSTLFVGINVGKAEAMKTDRKVVESTPLGALVPPIQSVQSGGDQKKGAPIPGLQPIRPSSAPPPATVPTSAPASPQPAKQGGG